jgi:hypothetical protein
MKLTELFEAVDVVNMSEKQQIDMVRKTPSSITDIYDAGIVPSEAVQMVAVTRVGFLVGSIKNPSEAVQLAAVRQNGAAIERIIDNGVIPSAAVESAAIASNVMAILYIKHPSPIDVKKALTDLFFISYSIDNYEKVVKRLFKDNQILMKKWIRYGETMRNQE